MNVDRKRQAAWILVVVVIVFWSWFGVGSALVEEAGWCNWLMHILIPGGIFILTAIVTWRQKRIGGILFALEGIVATGFLTIALLSGRSHGVPVLLMLLTLALPPFVAGILFMTSPRAMNGEYSVHLDDGVAQAKDSPDQEAGP